MAYEDTSAHLLAECDRIACLLDGYRTTLDRTEYPSQDGDSAVTGSSEPTTAVSESTHSDSESTVLGPEPTTLPIAVPAQTRADADARAEAISARIEESAASGTPLRLAHLVETFDLSDHHRDVLVLALLSAVDPQYQDVFTELQNDLSATQPTVGLVADLFSETESEFLAATRLVGSESPLRKHDLIRIGEPADTRMHRTDRPIFVENRIESYLLGHECIDAALEPFLEEVSAETTLEDLRIGADLTERLQAIAGEGGPQRMYWYGPPGTEKRRAVEAVSPAETFLRADLSAVLAAGLLERVLREARLLDMPLHLDAVSTAVTETDQGVTVDDVLDTFEPFDHPLVLTGTEEWTPDRSSTASIDAIVAFPRPSFAIRRRFWREHAERLPAELDPAVLAGTFELTQGELETALATAESLAGDGELGLTHVYDGCRAQSAGELAELAEQLEPGASWDDIELPVDTMRELRTVAAHVTYRGQIYADWQFSERFSRGTGVVALFSGPSGTGKTMAAEILATETGMELYKIDLSSVVSKYIGETEENLEQIFTEAEHSNAILLFDEADAVFGDRASVSDATDRYANVEVNYLLQRIESYNGVVLLTTNYESNIDSAFMRRIDHSVSFRRPQDDIRKTIWLRIFPDATPVDDLDYDFLASFDLTGGDIRTVAQTAAILAAADEGTITMKHVVRGLQRELQKSGTMVDPQEFEPFREFLYRD